MVRHLTAQRRKKLKLPIERNSMVYEVGNTIFTSSYERGIILALRSESCGLKEHDSVRDGAGGCGAHAGSQQFCLVSHSITGEVTGLLAGHQPIIA